MSLDPFEFKAINLEDRMNPKDFGVYGGGGMPIVIHKGEQLTHEDGKPYAKANCDIYAHGVPKSEDFDLEDGSHPEPNAMMPTSVFRVSSSYGVPIVAEVNIDGQWRKLSDGVKRNSVTKT